MSVTDWALDHFWLWILSAVLTGLMIAYCGLTVMCWHIDNEYPSLYPHRTLVAWIKVNQIDAINKDLHDLW